MNKIDFESRIKITILIFKHLHGILLKIDANERSITHKFAECLTPLFPRWDIDCEYNRVGYDQYDSKRIGLIPESINSDDEKATTIYPDIIIHRRGKTGLNNNLAVIEFKKNPTKKEESSDKEKIKKIKQELKYQIGIFLKCHTGNNFHIEFNFI